MNDFFEQVEHALFVDSAQAKHKAILALQQQLKAFTDSPKSDRPANPIKQAGLPAKLTLVPPRKLAKRGIQSQQGRNILMHSIAHIEFNAINLALDAVYRFRAQPIEFYQDWLHVAHDEARHFQLIETYLHNNDSYYGQYPAHNGLWDMAVKTADSVVARMALVPRVLEARGLDVTPGIIKRLKTVHDHAAIDRLQVIYEEEINHVKIGSKWFFHQCQQSNLDPKETFNQCIKQYLHGQLKGPFNVTARLMAGFDEMEMSLLNELADS